MLSRWRLTSFPLLSCFDSQTCQSWSTCLTSPQNEEKEDRSTTLSRQCRWYYFKQYHSSTVIHSYLQSSGQGVKHPRQTKKIEAACAVEAASSRTSDSEAAIKCFNSKYFSTHRELKLCMSRKIHSVHFQSAINDQYSFLSVFQCNFYVSCSNRIL